MKRRFLVLPLVLLSTAFYALPTLADPVDPATPGQWKFVGNRFAQRQIPNTDPPRYEDDKDKTEPGGVTTFNVSNMEVKCVAQRTNGERPKSALGRANYIALYDWQDGTGNNPPQPDQFFRADLTTGWECHATPWKDSTLPANQQAGAATGSGKGGSANNSSIPTMEAIGEQKEVGKIFDTRSNGNINRGFGVLFAQSASISVSSEQMTQGPPAGGIDGDPLPPSGSAGITYLNKACSAEGRTYGKASAARHYNPNTPTP